MPSSRPRCAPGALLGSAKVTDPSAHLQALRSARAAQWHRRPLFTQDDTPLRRSPRPRPLRAPRRQPRHQEGRALQRGELARPHCPSPGAPRHTPSPPPRPHPARAGAAGRPALPRARRRDTLLRADRAGSGTLPKVPRAAGPSARAAAEAPSPGSAPRPAPTGTFRRPRPSAAPRWDPAPASCHQPGHGAPKGRGGDAPGPRREVQTPPRAPRGTRSRLREELVLCPDRALAGRVSRGRQVAPALTSSPAAHGSRRPTRRRGNTAAAARHPLVRILASPSNAKDGGRAWAPGKRSSSPSRLGLGPGH